jgi:inorganic pyrophosphatase
VAFGHFRDISELPEAQVDRLKHYFLTYKRPPGETDDGVIAITHVYDRREALEVIERSREDYQGLFPDLRQRLLAQLIR